MNGSADRNPPGDEPGLDDDKRPARGADNALPRPGRQRKGNGDTR